MFGRTEQYSQNFLPYRQIGFCFKIALHCMVYMMFEFWINFIGHPGITISIRTQPVNNIYIGCVCPLFVPT